MNKLFHQWPRYHRNMAIIRKTSAERKANSSNHSQKEQKSFLPLPNDLFSIPKTASLSWYGLRFKIQNKILKILITDCILLLQYTIYFTEIIDLVSSLHPIMDPIMDLSFTCIWSYPTNIQHVYITMGKKRFLFYKSLCA